MKKKNYRVNLSKLFFTYLFLLVYLFVQAQDDPAWLEESWRTEQYPSNVFVKGYAQDGINANETRADAVERVKNFARANLTESILSTVKSINESYSESVMVGDDETVSESFTSNINVTTDLEINGVNIDTYVKDNIVYGFAHANKYEIIGFYKANLTMQVQQIEGFINTAKELEQNREKKKALDQYIKAEPIFEEVAKSQGILSAVDKNITDEGLQMQKTMQLYNEVVQAKARLAQGIIVYLETEEDLFGNSSTAIENNLKGFLAENGCMFTKDETEADWKIRIKATSREYNLANKVYFSYVDAEVKLFKAPSDKHVYQNEFSQKGAHSKSYKAAAYSAYNEISKPISDKILNWINN
jgi:hypothetical protein